MSGEICALGCAFCWAMSSTLTKSVTGKFQAMNLNLLRCLAASIFFWMIIPFSPGTKALTQAPPDALLYFTLSAVIGIAVGDTLYIRALRLINVTLAFPIAQSAMPLMTLGLAVLLLGEPLTWTLALGTVLILAGIYLIAVPEGRTRLPLAERVSERRGLGISLMLIASGLWAISIPLLKMGLRDVNPILANGVRLPVASLLLIFLVHFQKPFLPSTQAWHPRDFPWGINRGFRIWIGRDLISSGHPKCGGGEGGSTDQQRAPFRASPFGFPIERRSDPEDHPGHGVGDFRHPF